MRTQRILLMVVGIAAVAACAAPAAPTPSAATSGPSAAAGIQLRPAPADLGCDTMAVQYRSATFEIDAAAAEQVSAVTDTGATLQTFWSAGFQGGSADDPVVRDPEGQIVASDGEVLAIPEGDWPRLHGYFVCPSTDALYVLLQDPS